MPSWSQLINQINIAKNKPRELDIVRTKFLKKIAQNTGRNVIAYYSCWLKTPGAPNSSISDQDKNALMNAVHGLDRNKGLDIILHTPGGDLAATESIIDYLHKLFNGDIRAIIPQISMSAGTIIAMSCKSIIMGKQSSLGPIDPQMGGIACQAVLEEFKQAVNEISANPASAPLWQAIIGKYNPTFLITCQNAIKWSEDLMVNNLYKNYSKINIYNVKNLFLNNQNSYSHSRHISKEKCKEVGLNIIDLEDDQDLQDSVLSLHHSYMILMDMMNISKIVENQEGNRYVYNFRPDALK